MKAKECQYHETHDEVVARCIYAKFEIKVILCKHTLFTSEEESLDTPMQLHIK